MQFTFFQNVPHRTRPFLLQFAICIKKEHKIQNKLVIHLMPYTITALATLISKFMK